MPMHNYGKPGEGDKPFPANFGNKMPDRGVSRSPGHQAEPDGAYHQPYPTGGEVRRVPLGKDLGQMPENSSDRPIKHTPLNVGQGSKPGLGRMPEMQYVTPQTIPRRR